MIMSEFRKGYEFNGNTKKKIWKRSGGICEWLGEACLDQATTIDHITSVQVSAALNGGIPDKVIKRLANAQALCSWHDAYKKVYEDWFLRELRTNTAIIPSAA